MLCFFSALGNSARRADTGAGSAVNAGICSDVVL